MPNRFLVPAGGNWTDNTSWSTTDGGANDTIAPTASDDVFLTVNSGQCTISATSVGKTLTCTGYTNTLTHNAFVLNISGSVTLVAGMTYTPLATSTIQFSAAATLTTGGKLIPLLLANSGTVTLGDNLNFMASKVITFTINTANGPDLNGKTISGNSATNRVLIRAQTLGTARTIIVNGGTFANTDFRDITFSNATNLDLSAITGLSGDCGGNTITGGGTTLTFTTSATQTATGNSANYSAATWTSRVPLPQDDVVISLTAGQTLTFDMPRVGKSLSVTTAVTLSTNTIAQTIYGSLDLTNVSTFTSGSIGTWTFEGRGAFTITSAGQSFAGAVTINMVGGTLTPQDAFSVSGGGNFTITTGSFLNTLNVSITIVSGMSSTGSATRAITLGAATWTLSANSGSVWATNTTGLALDATGSTISITSTSASTKTFAGGGQTFNNLSITGTGTGAIIITGSNTFGNLPQVTGGTKTITITPGTTQTFTGGTSFGNGANVVTINTGGAAATFTKPSGAVINATSISLTNIQATQTNKWYAGPTPPSVDGGGNTNWIFLAAPSGSGFGKGRFSQNRFGRLPFGTQAFHG